MKLCPFCGGTVIRKFFSNEHWRLCINKDCGASTGTAPNEIWADQQWNRRAIDRELVERVWDEACQTGYDIASGMKRDKWKECERVIAELEKENGK